MNSEQPIRITKIDFRELLAKQGSALGNELAQVLCPVCRNEYVHFGAPYLAFGDDDYKAWEGRGDMAVIPMWCEQGHMWRLCIGFHKGMCYSFTQGERDEPRPPEFLEF